MTAGSSTEETSTAARPDLPRLPLRNFIEQAERDHIERVLRLHQGQIIPASASLGISRKSLYEKMKKYGMAKKDFRRQHEA